MFRHESNLLEHSQPWLPINLQALPFRSVSFLQPHRHVSIIVILSCDQHDRFYSASQCLTSFRISRIRFYGYRKLLLS